MPMPIKAMAKINKVKKNIGQNITQTFSAKIAFSCISNWSVAFILYICTAIIQANKLNLLLNTNNNYLITNLNLNSYEDL